jgi:prepilin-type N-terminal cleavage/methylation domain-containing protein
MVEETNAKGFTLIELMVVIGIIGILAAIAIPTFQYHKNKAYNSGAHTDVKNAFTAAQMFFNDSSSGSCDSVGILISYGFRQTEDVAVATSGTQGALQIVAYHASGDRTYTVVSDGTITNN